MDPMLKCRVSAMEDARRGTAGFSSDLGGRLLRYDFGTSQLRGAIGLSRGLLCVDQDQQGYRLTHLASCRACCPVSCDSIVGTV